jgi:hypothetical protein
LVVGESPAFSGVIEKNDIEQVMFLGIVNEKIGPSFTSGGFEG